MSISGQGQEAASGGSLLGVSLGLDINGDNSVSLDEIRQSLQEDTSRFQQEFNAWRISRGMGLEPALELSADSAGKVVVQGDHPYKEAVEGYFATNEDAGNLFSQISANASLYRAALEHEEFAAAYENDPQAAVAKYASLISGNDSAFSMLLGSGSGYLFDGSAWNDGTTNVPT